MSYKRAKYNAPSDEVSKVAVGTARGKGTARPPLWNMPRDLEEIIWEYYPVPWASELLARKFGSTKYIQREKEYNDQCITPEYYRLVSNLGGRRGIKIEHNALKCKKSIYIAGWIESARYFHNMQTDFASREFLDIKLGRDDVGDIYAYSYRKSNRGEPLDGFVYFEYVYEHRRCNHTRNYTYNMSSSDEEDSDPE